MSSLSQIANELSYDIDPSHTADPMIVLEDDSGADYGDDTDSTHTIDSEHSVYHYRDFHGRMYYNNISAFGDARYWEPVDRKHLDALDLKHEALCRHMDGRLFCAPLKQDIQNVLDVGTGTGRWAIDVAEKFPAASVIGIDIVPVQYDWVPPNVRFEIDSCTLKWTSKEGRFDYIHIRDLAGSITDWQRLCSEAYKCLKPGGILESSEASKRFEYTGSLSRGLERWYNLFIEAGNKTGRSFSVVEENVLRTTMKEVGFVDVHSESYKVPVKQRHLAVEMLDASRCAYAAVTEDPEGSLLLLATECVGWSAQEAKELAENFKREIGSRESCSFSQSYVWGIKPQTEQV